MATQGNAAPAAAVEAWLDDRPNWIREAAQKLVDTGKMPDQAGIDALADQCLAEASGTLEAGHPKIVPASSRSCSELPLSTLTDRLSGMKCTASCFFISSSSMSFNM